MLNSIKNQPVYNLIAKGFVWLGLAVILFTPLIVKSEFFFPFIVPKTLVFNLSVEIMFLAFLWLVFKGERNLRINTVVILLAIYIILSFISSLLGNNFYRSFWSNNERSEGILLLLHLFLLMIVLSSYFRKMKEWLAIFDIFFLSGLAVAFMALAQYFHWSWVVYSAGGSRLTSTIGNAGYVAGFLIFAIFVGVFLFFKRKHWAVKLYYGLVILLNIFIVINTGTRGGIIALFLAGFLLLFYLLFFYFDKKYIKIAGVAILVLIILAVSLLFSNKNSKFVKSRGTLNRVANMSLKSETAQNRFMAWHSAWQGFKDRPVWGWGYENFYQPFDLYFNPHIYRDAGSVVWFDRAHDIIFDRLLTGGLLGLTAYLLLIFWPLWGIWQSYHSRAGDKKKYFVPVAFTLIILAYFFQNLFIFEALVTYIPLILVLSFLSLFGRQYNFHFLEGKMFRRWIFVVWLVALMPVIYIVDIKPAKANTTLVQALSNKSLTGEKRVELFKKSLAYNTSGNQEYRKQFFNFYEKVMRQAQKSDDEKLRQFAIQFTYTMDQEIKKQLAEDPNNAMNYLMAMKFNNLAYLIDPRRLNNNLELYKHLIEIAPNRQPVYYEMAYTYFYLANYFKGQKEMDKANADFELSVKEFKKAIALNDKNPEPYRQLAILMGNWGEKKAAIDLAHKTKELSGNYISWADNFITELEK